MGTRKRICYRVPLLVDGHRKLAPIIAAYTEREALARAIEVACQMTQKHRGPVPLEAIPAGPITPVHRRGWRHAGAE
jgi:hypothetical protein